MQIIGILDILMLAIRSATPPLSPADIPSTSSMISTALGCFDLWNCCPIHIQETRKKVQSSLFILEYQPVVAITQSCVADKFFYRIRCAPSDTFLDLGVCFTTAITCIHLFKKCLNSCLVGKIRNKLCRIYKNTSMACNPSIWLTTFAVVVLPIPGGPLNNTAFLAPLSASFFPLPFWLEWRNCASQLFNQSWSCLTCKRSH